jgi:hypothetical protein
VSLLEVLKTEVEMYKNKKAILTCGSMLALVLGGTLAIAADDGSSSIKPSATSTDAGKNAKTSDRTPGNPSPDRTPDASSTGAVGTDAGRTTEGTSDRTPPKKDQKSME